MAALAALENLQKSKAMDRYAFAVLLEVDLELNIFKEFLTFEYAEENLLFWREIFEYDQIVKANLKEGESLVHGSKLYKVLKRKANKIADTFLEEGAPLSVNVSGEIREKLLADIAGKKDFAKNLFDPARKEVEELMIQGAYPRFNKSKSELIQASWDKITGHISPDEIGKILFMNWFMEAPEVMPRFRTNMSKHTRMWVDMFDTAVRLLADLRNLIPRLIQLGEKHVKYGAHDHDFNKLQKALMITLREIAEPEMTQEEERSWDMVFKIMTSVMGMAMKRQIRNEMKVFKVESADEKSVSLDIRNMSKVGMLKLLLFGIVDEECKPPSWECLDFQYDEVQFGFWRAVVKFQRDVDSKMSDNDLVEEAKDISKRYFESKESELLAGVFPKVVRASTKVEVSRMGTTKRYPIHPGVFDDSLEIIESNMMRQPFPTVKKVYIDDLRELWARATEHLSVAQLGKIIFITFFQNCPEVVPLFKNDIAKHGSMIAGMMNMAVSAIDSLETLIPAILEVGSRHFAYKVQMQYFESLGEAIVECLQHTLREEFTAERETAWRVVYQLLTHLMYSAIVMARKGQGSPENSVEVDTTSVSGGSADRRSSKKFFKLKSPISNSSAAGGANCLVM
eukprot:TRINITY_DN15130_c0_g1_i1.p1 TRINITY_DN15130_c0_g1~~TRINITY_DN15130_c0_g1_i1.p1  ORF type:complete len:635 (+),score=173.97 TRINITY_DN15130_c0_g1_i1:34-1905(+)